MRTPKRTHGFTLVELLVAMAIFVTIMGGVTVLFTGAVRTVRQGNQIIDAFSMGRGALEVMARDLGTAFTARELGQYHQFYGRPDGFTFVGKLSDGRLGRVTYAVHPDIDTRSFETVITEPWVNVWERAITRAGDVADAQRLSDPDRFALLDATSALVQAAYPAPSGLFADWRTNARDPRDSQPVPFTVRVLSHAMLRYEEPGVTDLDVFPPLRDFGGNDVPWPYIDPVDPAADEFRDGFETAANALYQILLGAVRRGSANDLRDVVRVLDQQIALGGESKPPFALNANNIGELIAAQRRDVWVRAMAGDPALPFQFWGGGRDPRDHVIAERILVTADLFTADGSDPVFIPGTTTFVDALLVPGAFLYLDDTERDSRWFNALHNVDLSTGGLYGRALEIGDLAAVEAFDLALVRAYGERRDAQRQLGSPLAPRIPAMVSPGLWLMLERPSPGAPDFRRWFTQTIDVPSAAGRAISPRVTARQRQG